MFKTKLEVDKHVENCLKKIISESERNVRYFSFAKLYFEVREYEQARRYVTIYLNAKPESAEAQHLLGRILEKLGKLEAALEAYRTSLDLDPKQNKLVLKVCELLASDNVNFDRTGARYFCEKAQTIDPGNPSVFSLKEKLILTEGKDPKGVAKLLLKELEERPRDVTLRVRLLRHFLQNNQIREAYEHARDIEQKNHLTPVRNLSWYEAFAEVLVRYQQETLKKNLNWEFWMLLIGVLDRLVDLSLDERSASVKTNNEYINNVFNFDQSLKVALESVQDCPDKNLAKEFATHYTGQLCFHFIVLVYKQAKKELIKYKEAAQISLPLLFISYLSPPVDMQCLWISHASENNKNLVKRWNRESAFRCSQTGHILVSISKDWKGAMLERAEQCMTGMWRQSLLKRIFITRDHQSKIKTSYFANSNEIIGYVNRLPEENELFKYDEIAQTMYPDSLHHHVWIGSNRSLTRFKCTVFEGLPYSCKNLTNCSAESLNVLDVQAFLYCAVLCAQQQIEYQKYNIYYSSDRPNVLPAAVTNQLGTEYQAKWLSAAYKMYTNDYSCDFSEVRLTLIRGIETIRCTGNHGLDVKLLVSLAKIFAGRSKTLEKASEIEQNDVRAELYWKTALPLLEKLKNNQTLSYPPNRLFDYKSKEMSLAEIQTHIDDGKLFNAIRLMKKKDYERALAMFDGLKDPYASFYQAQIYKTKAEEQTSRNKESVTSEMRSQNIILLSRARDCLYLTFDRLRDPSMDRRHPLNSQLGTEIDKIERMLSRIDPDTSNNRNDCDGLSDENMSSLGSMGDHFNYTYGNSSFVNGNLTPKNENFNLNSTPLRLDTSRREARPSPERLDAQLRQLLASKDSAVNHILEQNKFMMESHRALLDEIRGFKDAVNNLTSTVDEMKSLKSTIGEIKQLQCSVDELKNSVDDVKNVTDDVLKMKKEIAELKKDTLKIKSNQISDEDLYGLDEEYNNDYGAAMNSNIAGLTSNLYPALGRLPQPNSLQYGPALYHSMYPMLHYSGLGLPQTGSLPYASENQLPDFRALNPLNPQGLGPSPAAYLQPGFSQPGLAPGLPPGGLTQGLNLPQPVLPPTQGLPPPQTTIGQSSHTLPILPTTFNSIVTNTTIPNQSVFAPSTVSHIPTLSGVLSATAPSSSFLSSNNIPSSKAPPVNVVITSSDPLPPSKTTPQPVLSVIIPPQHLKGNQQKTQQQPHNYQIQMPLSSTVTTPSVINQPPIAITTQNLLSNVPPPVYSAVDQIKSVTLGLAIEKSLNQSFGNSSKTDLNKSNVSSASVEEHDPCPDFKPIIPLPDEVPVNTGEENETVLFEERAKLFRYTNKEWRERGVGVLKLLKDMSTGKVRLLMRRDQVHKICANHFLTKDMTLTAMPNNDKAYIWAANDFADQEIVLEKLCVRFKTAEMAQRFFDAFEAARRDSPEIKDKDEDKETKKDVPAKTESNPVALMGGFVFTSTPTFKPKVTPALESETVIKEIVKPLSPFASFSFSKPATTIPSTVAFAPVIPAQSSSETSLVSKSEPTSTTTNLETSEGEVEDYEPSIDFKPIVPLPELVEVKTGEENAEILFEQKAKLLRFDQTTKEWKERGIGMMKILKYGDNTVRLIMRREQVHKVCCNHQLLKSVSFSYMPNNLKVISWCAQDYSEGVLSAEMFAVKFKTEELTKQFHNILVSIQGNLDDRNCYIVHKSASGETKKGDKKSKADTQPQKAADSSPPNTGKQSGWGDKYKPKLGSWACKTCYIVNDPKTAMCVACDSPKNESAAKKESAISGTQFSFGVKSESPGNGFTFASKVESKAETKLDDKASASVVKSTWGNEFKPPSDSWECSVCLIRNTKDKLYCISCESPKDATVPPKEPTTKGISLDTPGFSFKFGIPSTNTTSAPVTNISSTSSPSIVVPPRTTANNSFGFGASATKSPAPTFSFGSTLPENKQFTFTIKPAEKSDGDTPKNTSTPETKEDKAKFVFGSPQKHTFDFTPRSPRRHSGGHGDEESEGSYVEEEEDNIYFKPVIPLPEKIDVKTGEEQEQVLYCHRAKLFRFADGEWKERGIGDIKVLKKPDSGKLRVVMRREQVLKICLNHILTSDIIYTPKDDKTWLFSAPDFSEGEIQRRQFCVRFKNAEVAQQFKKAIDGALAATTTQTITTTTTKVDKRDDSDVEIVFETKVTAEEEAEAVRLGLPPKFMSYRQLEDCKCDECKKDDVLLKEILYPTKSLSETVVATSPANNTAESSVFGTPNSFVAAFANKGKNTFSFTSCTSTPPSEGSVKKEETVKDLLVKPSLFAAATTSATTIQFGAINKPTVSFSSPALVSAASQQKPEEKAGNTASSTNFTFTLKPDAFPKYEAGSSASSFFSSTTTNLFNSPLNTSGSLFTPPKTGEHIFGGSAFNTDKIFATKAPAVPITKGNLFGATVTGGSANSGDIVEKSPAVSTASAETVEGGMFATPPVFGASLFGGGESKSFGSTPIFGSSQSKNLFGNTAATLSFGSNTTPATPLDCTVNNNSKQPLKKMDDFLKCDPNLNFASLARDSTATTPPTFVKSAGEGDTVPFAFLGAGAPVFGASKEKESAKEREKDVEETEDKQEGNASVTEEDYDPHYEPIVPLPEAVVVTTGEEDETALFNERAKLFRYDVSLKEWKERGIGQLKVLYHPTNHTFRLLLRREQVHKVVLNQLITPDLFLQPMSTSEKAWCWGGYNYSEDDHCLEKLAARFKSEELSKKFYDVIQNAIETIKKYNNQIQDFIPSTLEEYVGENVSGDEDRDTGEEVEGEEEEDIDYYDDGDDDERTIMFKERCTLSEQLPSGEWKPVGSGIIFIYYDSEFYVARITFSDEYNTLSNTLIGCNTEMKLHGCSCTWKAVEWANNVCDWRNLKATFETEDAAERFHITYQEGISYAEHSDVTDAIPTFQDTE